VPLMFTYNVAAARRVVSRADSWGEIP
jgi:hypothetical protein